MWYGRRPFWCHKCNNQWLKREGVLAWFGNLILGFVGCFPGNGQTMFAQNKRVSVVYRYRLLCNWHILCNRFDSLLRKFYSLHQYTHVRVYLIDWIVWIHWRTKCIKNNVKLVVACSHISFDLKINSLIPFYKIENNRLIWLITVKKKKNNTIFIGIFIECSHMHIT